MSDSLKYMGLGVVIAKVKFGVTVVTQKHGFGFKRHWYIYFDNLHDGEKKLVKIWADDVGLRFTTNRVYKKDDILAWLDALSPYEELLHDQRGLARLNWMLENPMPKSSNTWEEFLAWVERWDAFNEALIFN